MWKLYLIRFKSNPFAVLGAVSILMLIVIASVSPYITLQDPFDQDLFQRLQPPSSEHLLGTDELGRDLLSRILYATRVSLLVGVVAMSISLLIGTSLGLLAGYVGGWVDDLIMRFVDIMLCFPSFFLILMVSAFLEPNIYNVMIIIGLVSWPGLARLVRGECLSLREREFMLVAKNLGLSRFRMLFVHLLPNVISPVIVSATLGIGGAILTESSLSFLGLGVQPPNPSWGNILTSGKDYIYMAWWLSLFPGLAILFTVLSFNFLGEGMRDVLDPKLESI